ncbi:MAG: phage holin family protein, partial [Clostridia bacterium]|nr:phage holin family protein [Clostridia bacterium]
MKNTVITALGIIGGFVVSMLGGWSSALATLIVFMAVDYLTGLIAAGVFKKSPKTASGALNSGVGFKGIFKKIGILFVVMLAYRLDITANTNFVKNSVIIAYIANEFLSITENLALMGIYMP